MNWKISSGVGLGIIERTLLYYPDIDVRFIMACRSKSKCDSAMSEIKSQFPKANLVFEHLDLQDLESVFKFCDNLKK